jgi:membrane protein DedA with SNARE-associated domain
VLVAHAQHGLPFWPTLLAAYCGVVCSDMLWFLICQHYGTPLLHKKWFKRLVHPRRLLEAKHQIERRGAWVIAASRFIPGSRTTSITVAGMLQMKFLKFALVTASCVCITAPMQLLAGWLIGKGIGTQNAADIVKVIIGIIVLSVVLAIGLNVYRQHKASRQRAPRAKARWLRQPRPSNVRRQPISHPR